MGPNFLRILAIGLAALLALGASRTDAQGPATLTNADVAEMVRSGLPDSVIVAKIRTAPARFDVGTEALVALKRAGASDRVLEAMVAAGGAPAAVPAAGSAADYPGLAG